MKTRFLRVLKTPARLKLSRFLHRFSTVADPGFFFRGANLIKKTKRASLYFFFILKTYKI
jgi:hypothetical protein